MFTLVNWPVILSVLVLSLIAWAGLGFILFYLYANSEWEMVKWVELMFCWLCGPIVWWFVFAQKATGKDDKDKK